MSVKPETLLAQAGGGSDPATGAVVPPIHLSTTFERAPDGSYPGGYVYDRQGNPTRDRLEGVLADLEGGSACAAFSSGMAATAAVFQSLEAGDHVVLPDDVYYGTEKLLRKVMDRWGLSYTAADLTDTGALEAALHKETRLVWAETPSNPLLKITDLRAARERAHAAGALLAVDGTWTTPLLQRPFAYGADLVVHSATKYLAGHSDTVGGAVIAREKDDFFERVREIQTTAGSVMDPFGAWLTLRGMRTLAARLRLQCQNTRRLAGFLADHPATVRVHFPGLESHSAHAIAQKQMDDFGAMLSFEVAGGRDEAMAVAARTEVFTRATSLGGTESLIEHRASTEPPERTTPEALLRLSVGLEHPDDLQADLAHALSS